MATRTETGAKRYFAGRSNETAYADVYRDARRRIDRIDHLIQDLDQRREAVGMTKAELARRSDLTPEVVRRLFTVSTPNPTIGTLTAIADALDVELVVRVRATASN